MIDGQGSISKGLRQSLKGADVNYKGMRQPQKLRELEKKYVL